MLDDKMTDIMNKGLKEAQRQQQAYKKLNKVNVGTKGHIDHGTNPLQEAFEQWCDENYYYKSTQIDRKYSHELQLVWEASAQHYESEIAELKADQFKEIFMNERKRIAELEREIADIQVKYEEGKLHLPYCNGDHTSLIGGDSCICVPKHIKQAMTELQASNNDLRDALETCEEEQLYNGFSYEIHKTFNSEKVKQALSATPAETLQVHDDELIEKCAAICDKYGHGWKVLGDEIRTLKGTK